MRNNVKDMTHGSPSRLIVSFALPLMLGNVFQQAYTMTDAAIVGQFAGVDALAAIGSADWLCWLIFGMIGSFMQGFSILVAQRFGSGDLRAMRRAVSTLLVLSAAVIVGFTGIGFLTGAPLLRLMQTQEAVFDSAVSYLYVLYGGIVATTAYNLLSSLLRALGNSRAPLIAMVIASVTNIGLDLLFVVVFHWGVVGAAAATVIAQLFAAFICLAALLKLDALRFEKGEFTFHGGDAKVLLRLALPMVFQNVMICGGGMALQTVINRQSFAFVAGFTASNKLYCVLEAAAVSFGYAITTYTGQNLGAKEYDRIRRGTKSALGICFLTSVLVAGLMFLIGRPSLSLFIASSADPSVMDVALRYLYTMSCTLPILYFLYVYRSALQGMGDTVMPMVSGLAECAMRVSVAWILTAMIGSDGIYYAEPSAWLGATVILFFSYYYRERRLERKEVSA